MDDEVELFECQIAEGYMTLGWIHTHPQFVSIFNTTLNLMLCYRRRTCSCHQLICTTSSATKCSFLRQSLSSTRL